MIEATLAGLTAGYDVVNHAGNTASAAFTQSLTAAISEPETCALMLAGLGLVGFAARRRIC